MRSTANIRLPPTSLGTPSSARIAPGHLNLGADLVFSSTYHASQRLLFGGVESSMGCKQYAPMLGLSRGYPHILYLDLNKWDATPRPGLFHKTGISRVCET